MLKERKLDLAQHGLLRDLITQEVSMPAEAASLALSEAVRAQGQKVHGKLHSDLQPYQGQHKGQGHSQVKGQTENCQPQQSPQPGPGRSPTQPSPQSTSVEEGPDSSSRKENTMLIQLLSQDDIEMETENDRTDQVGSLSVLFCVA